MGSSCFLKSLSWFIIASFFTALGAIIYGTAYYYYMALLNELFTRAFTAQNIPFHSVRQLYLTVFFMEGILVFSSTVFSAGLLQSMYVLRTKMTRTMFSTSSWREKKGAAITRFTSDVDEFEIAVTNLFSALIALSQVLGPLYYFVKHALSFGLWVVSAPLLYIILGFLGLVSLSSYSKRLERQFQETYDEIHTLFKLFLTYNLEIRMFGTVALERKFNTLIQKRNKLGEQIEVSKALYSPFLMGYVILGLSLAASVFYFSFPSSLLMGYIVFFTALITGVGSFFASSFIQVYKTRALVPRIIESLSTSSRPSSRFTFSSLPPFATFRHLYVMFGEKESSIPSFLRGTAFRIPTPSLTMIVLPPLSGKTLLSQFLCGRRSLPRSRIVARLKDQQDFVLPALALQSLTSLVGTDDYLFSGSIAENVLFQNHSRNLNHNFLRDFNVDFGSWDTVINPKLLSGGQKRRLSLLRGVCSSTPIVVIDEPFKGLDVDVQTRVLESLQVIGEEKTVVLLLSSLILVPNAFYIIINGSGAVVSGYGWELLEKKLMTGEWTSGVVVSSLGVE